MMKINLIGAFTYWHGGHSPKVYGPGEVDVPDEVAASALLCGFSGPEEEEAAGDSEMTAPNTEQDKAKAKSVKKK